MKFMKQVCQLSEGIKMIEGHLMCGRKKLFDI